MQQPNSSTPSIDSASFAGLLAALTSPAKEAPPAWNDDDLADDVATLSYERALRAHSRYKLPDATDQALTQPRQPEGVDIFEAKPTDSLQQTKPDGDTSAESASAAEKNLKEASITIRLSRAECTQLRLRSAEAGLSVSAYIRSCTFEAESLRALVKDTLARILSEASPQNQPAPGPSQQAGSRPNPRPGWRNWLVQHMPEARGRRRAAQALLARLIDSN
jgi:predicted DNA binding CopG/RHH family protein